MSQRPRGGALLKLCLLVREETKLIRWCAFCQKFYGFGEPIEKFSLTHGICPHCQAAESAGSTPLYGRKEQQQFFEALSQAAMEFDFKKIDRLIDDGLGLGISAQDLLIRVLQPSLYEIGRLWETAKISVADEHRFTAVSTSIMELLFTKYPATKTFRSAKNPKILLMLAEHNRHVLGLKMIEFLLAVNEIPTFALYPGLPPREVFTLCQEFKPSYVGISIALPQDLNSVVELRRLFDDAKQTTGIIVGGYSVARGVVTELAPKIEAYHDIDQLIGLL